MRLDPGSFTDSAAYSEDRLYRYRFERRWGRGDDGPFVVWVGLNPSTGDTDNGPRPTLRRMVSWSHEWGASSLIVVNLFAWRSTDPKALKTVPDPVGPLNNDAILQAARSASKVVVCWGGGGRLRGRGAAVAELLPGALCFGVTLSGHPRHPLFVPSGTELRPFCARTR